MNLAPITTSAVPAKTGLALMARIKGNAGTLVTQASLSSITLVITDVSKEAQTPGSGAVARLSLSVSSVIFDALQQGDAAWTKDSAASPGADGLWGYNFKTVVPASWILNSGDRYQFDVQFVPQSGENFVLQFQALTLKTYV